MYHKVCFDSKSMRFLFLTVCMAFQAICVGLITNVMNDKCAE